MTDKRAGTRERIVTAAATLLRQDGPAGVTTRAVAERAGVQPPAIYRLFGDKDGLLEAVAEHVMGQFAAAKAQAVRAAATGAIDPLQDLRDGWDAQIAFGLANPALFRLLSDPDRVSRSPAARSGRQVLEERVRRIAATGRMRVSELRAMAMITAAGVGAIQTQLATPPEQRDPGVPGAIYDAVLAQILDDGPAPAGSGPLGAVVTLRAVAAQLTMLSPAERGLLDDWLRRIADGL